MDSRAPQFGSHLGCFMLLFVLMGLCLFPIFLFEAMETILRDRLHLSPAIAVLAVLGIFLGGLVNIPIYNAPRDEELIVYRGAVYGLGGWIPGSIVRPETVVAVNLGGCVIPTLIAIWEMQYVLAGGLQPLLALAIATGVNIAVCYRVAKPVRGVGITMPGFVPPIVAVGITWLLLSSDLYEDFRAPVAFVAGVSGPLIGADLLNLRKLPMISSGLVSIGGAGTFDGIVLSGMGAAFLAGL